MNCVRRIQSSATVAVIVFLLISLTTKSTRSLTDNSTNTTLTFDVSATTKVLTMCYLIERNTSGMTYDYNKAAASLALAKQYANEVILPPEIKLESIYRNIGQKCGGVTHVIAIASELRDEGIDCDVYIGPGCGTAVEILHNIVSVWDKPIIGCPASGLGLSADASLYTVVSRTSVTYVSITMVLLRFLEAFNYTTPAVFQDQSVNFFQQLGVLMQETIDKQSEVLKYGTKFYPFNWTAEKTDAIKGYMIKASLASRVFVISASAIIVRRFLLLAHQLGMTTGDYIFIAVELFPSDVWGMYTWERYDDRDAVAREAYHTLALISLQSDTKASAAEFWRQVIKVSRENYSYEFSATEKEVFDPIVAHFYDSVLLYANMVTLMAGQGLNYSSGLEFTNLVANYTFTSPVTGTISFNGDSDRLMDYEFRFFHEPNGKHEAVLAFPATSSIIKPLGTLVWMDQTTLPPNTPYCGYLGENPKCAPVHVVSSGAKAGVVIGVVLFLIGLGCASYSSYKKVMYSKLDPFWWRILEQDLSINNGLKSTKSMMSVVSGVSGLAGTLAPPKQEEEENESVAPDTHPSRSGTTATFNNTLVSILPFPEPKQRVPANISRDAFLVRSMQHNNIQKFVGIAVNDANLCDYLVAEVCAKGSLQDLIENIGMHLDWEFKNALIKDLTNGMVYIHSSPIESHGFLTDAVCQIDSRFILKVGGYGFDCLRHREDLEAYHISQADQRDLRILLWRAPELLRRAMPPAGTQKGDVYSYAILLQQIILRTEPFQKGHHHAGGRENTVLNTADIVHEVCRGLTPPLRPPVPMSACSHAVHELMESCWNEDPLARPNFIKVRAIVQNAIKKSGDNIVDHLIKRMEVYAADLENQVTAKTKEFMEERQRSAELLQEILPKAVAEALAKGHQILPETFPTTTVYFHSVVGFKEAVARAKSPLETVTMLNNLYSACDAVMSNLDVFKVEVVVDAYLVVSGLPVRNGMRHVENIATMALHLRREVAALVTTGDAYKLRVGMNSGPCVAGVVGLKMPRYCLFGDTVNTASRMESHGEAGKIHVSPTSKALLDLHDDFVLVERGVINVKGKGEMMTYWLVGRN